MKPDSGSEKLALSVAHVNPTASDRRRREPEMKHDAGLPIAILLGISIVSSGFALDLGVTVANQTLTLGTYQNQPAFGGPPLTCALVGLTAEQSLGSVATANLRVCYVGGSVVAQLPNPAGPGSIRDKTVANGLEGRVTGAARIRLIEQRLTATAGVCVGYDGLRQTDSLGSTAMDIRGFTQGLVAGVRVQLTKGVVGCGDLEFPVLGQFSSAYTAGVYPRTAYSANNAGTFQPVMSLSVLFSL